MSAAIWDSWNALGGPKYPHEKVIQFCFRNYPPNDRGRAHALDLGCGSGVHTVFLASEGFEVTGVDVSRVGIENTRRKLDALNLQADLRVGSVDTLDLPAATFDLVLCVGVYESVGPEIARASLMRVTEVLKDRGRGFFLFASDRDFQVHGPNPYRLHGFTEREVHTAFGELFGDVWVDRYITTYEGGRIEQNDWLVTVRK